MKKILAILLALGMVLSLTACSTSAPEESASTGNVSSNAFASVAGEYTYEESLPFGSVPWVLTLAEDGSYSLSVTKPTGDSYVYTGNYAVDGSTVVTGAPVEDTADIEADFFNSDFSCAWIISPDGTMTPEQAGNGDGSSNLDGMDFSNISLQGDVEPADAIGNTYIYEETNAEFGFTTAWELTFADESSCTLFEPNDMMGDTTYSCTYTYADGQYTVSITESSSGQMPLSSMFDTQ